MPVGPMQNSGRRGPQQGSREPSSQPAAHEPSLHESQPAPHHRPFRNHFALRDHRPFRDHRAFHHGPGFERGIGSQRCAADLTRRSGRRKRFLIVGRLHGRSAYPTGIGAAGRRRAGTVLGIIGRGKRLRFEHDFMQRQCRGPWRRIGGHVAPRRKARLRTLGNRDKRITRVLVRCLRASGIGRIRTPAQNPLAGHIGHFAAGQGLDGALQADLLANARFQFDAPSRRHVAANHSPAVEDDVGCGSAGVGGIAVELPAQGGTGRLLGRSSPATSLFGGVCRIDGDGTHESQNDDER